MSTFISSNIVYSELLKNALNGIKVPHRVSQPLIHKTETGYELAAFVFFYNKDEIQKGQLQRPLYWLTADMEDGKILKEYDCKTNDYIQEPFDLRYDGKLKSQLNFDKKYFEDMFVLLDDVRKEYLEKNILNHVNYSKYMDLLLESIPVEYQKFYSELSIK